MAIRKDLDAMLNNLKAGAPTAPKAEEPKPVKAAPHKKKNVYDEMSVDDLLSALTDEKKSAEKQPVKTEKINFPSRRSAVEPSLERKLFEALDPSAKPEIPEKKAAEAIPTETAEPEPKPAKPEAPKERRKKKIIITGELPDYEAIRREELEKNRIESEKAEAAARSAARKANELTPVEAIAAEAIAAAEVKAAEELPEAESAPKAEISQETAEEAPEEKQKGGFFSKLKNMHNKDVEEEVSPMEATIIEEEIIFNDTPSIGRSAADEEHPDTESLYEIEAAAETAISDAFSEAIAEAAAADDEIPAESEPSAEEEIPSVDELLDAAIAEIRNAQAAETSEAALDASEAESDSVSGLIDDIREDTAAAIAELEKTPEEKAEEAESAEAPVEIESAEDAPEAEEKPKRKLVLRRILDEDPNAIINERSEKTENDEAAPQETQKGKFKKRLYMILGAVFSVFAVIGIVTVIIKGVGLIHSFTSGEVKRDGFTEMIYPAVIMDIESFGDPAELTSNQIITASIWSIVMSEERVSKYTVNPGTDTIFIPYMDVEARAVEMFGPEHPEFNHCTVGPMESRFVYADGAYNVKLAPITFTYSPEIKSIVKSGNTYTLTVDYIDELPAWMEKSVAKSVKFKLIEKEDGSYTIDSMEILFVKSSNI